jgi:hypothetical protein
MSRGASYATIVESVTTDISSGDITARSVLTSTP